MFKNWLLAGVVVLGGSAFVAHEADAFGHHRRGHRSNCCNPCGGYAQPVVIQQPISGGCCGSPSPISGPVGYGVSGYRGAVGGYGHQGPGVGVYTGLRGVGTGLRGVGMQGVQGATSGVRGVTSGVTSGVRGVIGGVTGR